MKTAAIGLTGRATIQKNHSMLPDTHAKMGFYKSNPMRMDVEEIGRLIGVNYALNVVLNDEKQIVKAFWGDPYRVMETGIPYSLNACQLDVSEKVCRFDLVIASAGGYPKDINLYQSQKALTNACLFSKPGGVIILAAGCRDGAGNSKFVEYIRGKKSWEEVLADFPNHPFEIGPHKRISLLAGQGSSQHPHLKIACRRSQAVHADTAGDMQEALRIAAQFLPDPCRTVVLPFATHSMPKMDREEG
jgi:nickel-dependent lactate racemase